MKNVWMTSAVALLPLAFAAGAPKESGTALAPTLAGARAAQTSADAFPAEAQPRRAVVPGVPFISWSSMARASYADREIRNPSMEASSRMILSYWDDRLVSDADFAAALTAAERDLKTVDNAQDLKAHLARGIPAIVLLALTPRAHPLCAPYDAMVTSGIVRVKQPRAAASGALGMMLALDEVEAFEKMHTNPVSEMVTAAARTVVGYDDDLRVWYLHDPSFGPAMPLSYPELERMQKPVTTVFVVLEPPNAQEVTALRQSAGPYRERTSDERAAWDFVNGYANSATGELQEGERRFRAGLALPDVSPGYRFLLNYELALTLQARGEPEQALDLAQEATRLIPDHPGPWQLVAEIGAASRSPELKALGADAASRSAVLQADRAAAARVAASIPADLLIYNLFPVRGWGGESILSPPVDVAAR